MCGIVGCIGKRPGVADLVITGLVAIQGRGSQAAGMAAPVDSVIKVVKGEGEITNIKQRSLAELGDATVCVGHIRYGTKGTNLVANAHPFVSRDGKIALAHNGEILNVQQFKEELMAKGVEFESDSDSEVLLRLLEHEPGEGMVDRIMSVLSRIDRAYALVLIWDGNLIGICDPYGTHPLHFGRLENGAGGFVFASEDVAIKTMGGVPIKDVKPGHILVVSPNHEVLTYDLKQVVPVPSKCSFNFAYTARPDTCMWGRSVSQVRIALGHETFGEMVASSVLPMVDLITPVLDSGRTATLAFAKAYACARLQRLVKTQGLNALQAVDPETLFPFGFAINRAQHQRNFQMPAQTQRDSHILIKHGIDASAVTGRRILVGDDSIVRSTTAKRIVAILRKWGAIEVHFVVFSPPIMRSCPYGGTETKDSTLLVGANHSAKEIAEIINADSVYYLSLAGYQKVMEAYNPGYCFFCHS